MVSWHDHIILRIRLQGWAALRRPLFDFLILQSVFSVICLLLISLAAPRPDGNWIPEAMKLVAGSVALSALIVTVRSLAGREVVFYDDYYVLRTAHWFAENRYDACKLQLETSAGGLIQFRRGVTEHSIAVSARALAQLRQHSRWFK
jgi:hypothetical protein